MEQYHKPFDGFKAVWNESNLSWDLENERTGTKKSYVHFIDPMWPTNKAAYLYDTYLRNTFETAVKPMTSDFLRHWLTVLVELNASYIAEDAYSAFLSENKKTYKKVGKLYKDADFAYDAAFDRHIQKYWNI